MNEFIVLQFCIYLFSIYVIVRWKLYGIESTFDFVLALCALSVVAFALLFRKKTSSTKRIEAFVESSSPEINYENKIINTEFKEDLIHNDQYADLKEGLAYYISSYVPSNIDFSSDVIYNAIDSNVAAVIEHSLLNNNFHQQLGFKVNSQVVCYPCNQIFNNYTNFTIFTHFKLGVKMYNSAMSSSNTFTLLTLYTNNVMRTTRFLEVLLEYKSSKLNPSIILKFCGDTNSTRLNNMTYSYSYNDYLKGKIFADGKYHTMVLTKNNNKIKLFMDDFLLINCDPDEQTGDEAMCFDKNSIQLSDGDTEIQPSTAPFRINYNNKEHFWFWMNNFGVYPNRVLTENDIKSLHKVFMETDNKLDPKMQQLLQEKQAMESTLSQFTTECPYPEYICTSPYCRDVKNWRDVNDLTMDQRCFKAINAFCSENGAENPGGCAFASEDAVFKMASAIDPTLFYYKKGNITGNVGNDPIAKERLARLGLKDMYLDKSIKPPDGRQVSNLNKTIDDLLETNQTVSLDTINAVGTSPPEVGKKIDIDGLLQSTANMTGDDVPSFEELYQHLLTSELQTGKETFVVEEEEDSYQEEEDAALSKYKAIMQAYKSKKLKIDSNRAA